MEWNEFHHVGARPADRKLFYGSLTTETSFYPYGRPSDVVVGIAKGIRLEARWLEVPEIHSADSGDTCREA
jgi:hypothetical protein